jgi:hypothetical protein
MKLPPLGHSHGQCVACVALSGSLGTIWFIEDYDTIAAPLTQLLRKEGFASTPEATTAFDALKCTLSTAPVLHLPNFNRPFMVDYDASRSGFRAVLHQGTSALAFFSHLFTARHLKLAAYKQELIRLVQAVRHWCPYLWGHHFLIRTDHYVLKFMLNQRLSTVP